MAHTAEELLSRLEKAQTAFRNEEYAEALKHYHFIEERIQDDLENLPVIQIEIGWSYYQLQRFAKSADYLNRALASEELNDTQRFDCLKLVGFSESARNKLDLAMEALGKAVAIPIDEPLKRYAYFELGKICFSLKQYNAALPILQKAEKYLDADDEEYKRTVQYYLGFIAFFSGDLSEAQRRFQYYIKNATPGKGQAPGYFGMAHIFYENGEYPALVDASEKVIQSDPDFYDRETLGYFLCCGYMEMSMWEQLADFLPNLMQQFPDGRYKPAYPLLEEAMKKRRKPPRSKN